MSCPNCLVGMALIAACDSILDKQNDIFMTPGPGLVAFIKALKGTLDTFQRFQAGGPKEKQEAPPDGQ